LSEATERIFRKYGISTAVKHYKTLRNLLIHPKDKRTIGQTGECVYKIPCHNWSSRLRTLEKQAGAMQKEKRSTQKKLNPSATEH